MFTTPFKKGFCTVGKGTREDGFKKAHIYFLSTFLSLVRFNFQTSEHERQQQMSWEALAPLNYEAWLIDKSAEYNAVFIDKYMTAQFQHKCTHFFHANIVCLKPFKLHDLQLWTNLAVYIDMTNCNGCS